MKNPLLEKKSKIKNAKKVLKEIGIETRARNASIATEIELVIINGNRSERLIQEKLFRAKIIKNREDAGFNPEGIIIIY